MQWLASGRQARHIAWMRHSYPFLLPLFALSACGSGDSPDAPPGAVERTADALDRNAAIERNETIERIESEADARARDSKRRIKAIESERGEAN